MKPSIMKISNKLRRKYAELIERLPYVNWFNPFLTVYINLKMFPLGQAVHFPLYIYGRPRLFSLYGSMECADKCKRGMIKINATITGTPSLSGCNTELNIWGKIIFRGTCDIYTSNKITVGDSGILDIGDGARFMTGINLVAYENVKIGKQALVAHCAQILDSNFHYVADILNRTVSRYSKPIVIGDYCWICNNSTIAMGGVIPNNTIVASNSLVNKVFTEQNTIVGGCPAKVLKTNQTRIFDPTYDRYVNDYFIANQTEREFRVPDNWNINFL